MRFLVFGNSMLPTYPAGSKLFVSKIIYVLRKPRVGDIVVLRDPRDGRLILKRIKSQDEGEYLVEGDNPLESTDSRYFGPVKKGDIIGKVMFQYSKNKTTWFILLVAIFAIVGLTDSLYLTYVHYQQDGSIVCSATSGTCDIVTSSKYSVVMGIPLAALGTFFYSLVLVLISLYRKRRSPRTLRIFIGWTTLGFMTSVYLTYLQAFVIHAYCPFCLASAATSTLLFLSVLSLAKEGNNGMGAGV